MKSLTLFFIALLSISNAAPLKLKDTKGREILAEVTGFDDTSVTFTRNSKSFTVPWKTFDPESIEKIKSISLPNLHNKRPDDKITLEVKDGDPKTLDATTDVYFNDEGVLELYPGDTVHLEFQEADGELINPQVVGEVTSPERSFTFKFIQNKNAAILHRLPGLKETAIVDCSFRDLSGDTFESKNLYPSELGRVVVDLFPATVWTVRISNIRLTDERAQNVVKEEVEEEEAAE